MNKCISFILYIFHEYFICLSVNIRQAGGSLYGHSATDKYISETKHKIIL